MLELPFVILPLYITVSVMFLLTLQLWYGGERIIYHDVRVLFIFENVPTVVVKDTRLGNL